MNTTETIIAAIKTARAQARFPSCPMVEMPAVRRVAGLPDAEFDRGMLALAKARRVILHHGDDRVPGVLYDGAVCYPVVALPRAA